MNPLRTLLQQLPFFARRSRPAAPDPRGIQPERRAPKVLTVPTRARATPSANPARAALALLLCLAAASAQAGRYTKIANNGAVLPASAVLGSNSGDWACTRDNTAGLLWEVKTADGGTRDQNKYYTNYDSSYDPGGHINDATNSIGFANAVNGAGLCGYTGWRLPSVDELLGLVNISYTPTIDPTYFPNTLASNFWSGSPVAGVWNGAWAVYFDGGADHWEGRGLGFQVRLVRAGQFIDHFVSVTGAGAGRIVADGIDCIRTGGATYGICSTLAWLGSTVTLAATPIGGSAFTAWGGACSGTGATCTLTFDAAKTVTADFSAAIATRAIVIDPAAPATLYAGIEGAGVYKSSNSGVNWTAAATQPGNLQVTALVIQPGDGTRLFAATYGGGVFKSSDSGVNWAACLNTNGGLTNLNLLSLAMDAPGKLYAGSEAGVFVSADGCDNWTAMNNGMP